MPTVTTRRKMGPIALTFHIVMMFCTVGLWTPILLMAMRGRKTVTHYDGPPPGQQQQPYGPPPGQYPHPYPPQQGWQQPGPPQQQYPPQAGPSWGQRPPHA